MILVSHDVIGIGPRNAVSHWFRGKGKWKNAFHQTLSDEQKTLELPGELEGLPGCSRASWGFLGKPMSWTATDEKLL